jgi:hypothetical protein
VDHDHTTGQVRGVLCFSCNVAIGHLGDSADRVRRAADYLQGRKIELREVAPGYVQITYPEPPPPPRPPARRPASSPPIDITALREAALRA